MAIEKAIYTRVQKRWADESGPRNPVLFAAQKLPIMGFDDGA